MLCQERAIVKAVSGLPTNHTRLVFIKINIALLQIIRNCIAICIEFIDLVLRHVRQIKTIDILVINMVWIPPIRFCLYRHEILRQQLIAVRVITIIKICIIMEGTCWTDCTINVNGVLTQTRRISQFRWSKFCCTWFSTLHHTLD